MVSEAPKPSGNARLRDGGVGGVVDRDGLGADEVAAAARQEHAGQRHDERREVEALDQEALQRAERRAEHQHQRHGGVGIPARVEQRRGDHRRQRDDRAHRQVDAARQDHEGHAHRDDAQEGVVDEQVEEHLRRQEPVVADGAERRHRDEQQRS